MQQKCIFYTQWSTLVTIVHYHLWSVWSLKNQTFCQLILNFLTDPGQPFYWSEGPLFTPAHQRLSEGAFSLNKPSLKHYSYLTSSRVGNTTFLTMLSFPSCSMVFHPRYALKMLYLTPSEMTITPLICVMTQLIMNHQVCPLFCSFVHAKHAWLTYVFACNGTVVFFLKTLDNVYVIQLLQAIESKISSVKWCHFLKMPLFLIPCCDCMKGRCSLGGTYTFVTLVIFI